MRRANALSAAALKYGGEHIEAGMTTWELDKLIYDFIKIGRASCRERV